MDLIKNGALMLLTVIFCVGILKLMIPKGNLKKITSMLMSMLFIFLMISVFKNVDGVFDIEGALKKSESVNVTEGQEDFKKNATSYITSNVEKSIEEEICKRTNLKNVKVIVTPLFENDKILLKSVKIYSNQKLDKDEIKRIVNSKFQIEKEKIFVEET